MPSLSTHEAARLRQAIDLLQSFGRQHHPSATIRTTLSLVEAVIAYLEDHQGMIKTWSNESNLTAKEEENVSDVEELGDAYMDHMKRRLYKMVEEIQTDMTSVRDQHQIRQQSRKRQRIEDQQMVKSFSNESNISDLTAKEEKNVSDVEEDVEISIRYKEHLGTKMKRVFEEVDHDVLNMIQEQRLQKEARMHARIKRSKQEAVKPVRHED